MDIVFSKFEKEMKIKIGNQEVAITCFETDERSNIKIGIDAPRSVSVNREEVYKLKRTAKQ